jgi:hypothetical protein
MFVNLKHLGRDGERGVGVGEKPFQTGLLKTPESAVLQGRLVPQAV